MVRTSCRKSVLALILRPCNSVLCVYRPRYTRYPSNVCTLDATEEQEGGGDIETAETRSRRAVETAETRDEAPAQAGTAEE